MTLSSTFQIIDSLRGWRDFARESFFFGGEAVGDSVEAYDSLIRNFRGWNKRVIIFFPASKLAIFDVETLKAGLNTVEFR